MRTIRQKLGMVMTLLLVFTLLAAGNVSAAEEGGSFIASTGYTEKFDYDMVHYDGQLIDYLYFYDVGYYKNLQSIKIENIPITGASFTTGALSSQTNLVVKDGADTIGTGSIGFGKNVEEGNFSLYIYLYTWDIGARTGDLTTTVEFNDTELGINAVFHWSGYYAQSSDDELGLKFMTDLEARTIPYDYTVVHTSEFQNDYLGETYGGFYRVNITKTIDNTTYESFWKISTASTVYLNGSSTLNESVIVGEAPIFLYCVDGYNNTYSDTIFEDTATSDMYGIISDLTNSTGIEGAEIVVGPYNDTSGSSGAYTISGMPVGSYNVTVTAAGYHPNNFTVSFEYASTYNINMHMMPLSMTYDNGSVAGSVTSLPYNMPLEDATVYLSNGSYSTTTTTSSSGFYIFDGLSNDTYDVYVTAEGFDTSSIEAVVVVTPDFTIQDFEMNPKYVITIQCNNIETGVPINNFSATIDGVLKGSVAGAAIFADIEYGWVEIAVNASGYYATTKTAYVDADATITVFMQQTEGAGAKFERHYVAIKVVNWYWRGIEGVNVSTGETYNLTGTDGVVGFEMIQNRYYTIVMTHTEHTKTITLMPVYNEYIIFFDLLDQAPPQDTENWYDFVNFTVATDLINSTHAYINLTFVDTGNGSSNLYTFVNNSSDVNLENSNGNISIVVDKSLGASFYVGFHCDYVGYDDKLSVKKVVVFPWDLGEDSAFTDYTKSIMGIAFLILLGAIFGTITVPYGGIVLPMFALILNWAGWFTIVDDTTTKTVCVTALVLAIMLYMRARENEAF